MAFHLAADFSTDAYETRIRPDMTAHDPHFSRLFYADHKELVTCLRVLKRVPDDFEEEFNRIYPARHRQIIRQEFIPAVGGPDIFCTMKQPFVVGLRLPRYQR